MAAVCHRLTDVNVSVHGTLLRVTGGPAHTNYHGLTRLAAVVSTMLSRIVSESSDCNLSKLKCISMCFYSISRKFVVVGDAALSDWSQLK